MTKTTALTNMDTVDAANDLLLAVDVSDTTMSSGGTSKKLKPEKLLEGVTAAIAGKANTSHTHLVANLSDATADAKQLLQSYANTDFATSAHTHILSDVEELVDALASKYDSSHVGTTANKLVQLTSEAKLPAVDGSLLTNLPSGSAWADLSADESVAFGSNTLEFDGRFQPRGGLTFIKTTSVPQAPTAYTQPQKDTFKQGWQIVSNGGTPSYDSIYPDNIMKFGWNLNGEVYNEPRFSFDFESAFRNANGSPDLFEWNINIYTQNGNTFRPFGMTMPRADLSTGTKDVCEAGFYVNSFTLGSIDDSFSSAPSFTFDMRTTVSPGKKFIVGADGTATTHILLNSNNVAQIKQSVGGGNTLDLPYASTFEGNDCVKTTVPISCQYNATQQVAIYALSNQSGMKFLSNDSGSFTFFQFGATTYADVAGTMSFRDTSDASTWLRYNGYGNVIVGRAGSVVEIKGGYLTCNLPTSNPGAGYLWNDGGTVKVGT